MSENPELTALDATGQAELVATGQVTARELVDHAIARIEARNPELNAVIWSDPEAARAVADAEPNPSGPFGGVPFLIKDIGANQVGLPNWLGNRALRDADLRASADTVLGARFRDAGLITVGKTNLPELGSSPTTQPLSFGPTRNPWDPDRPPAGSSGGAGAAVAGGLVAMAHANDGGGSTRLPAAWCGLVGLKTTRGRMPNPETTSRMVSELAVTKSVRDTARLLDAVAGHTAADLYHLPSPDEPFAAALDRSPSGLRIRMLTDGGPWAVDPACVEAVEHAARVLEELGHHVEATSSDTVLGGDSELNGRLWTSGLATGVANLGRLLGRPLTEDEVDPYNWTAAERGRAMTVVELDEAVQRQQRWAAEVLAWSEGHDLLLTPTSGAVPMRTDELWPDEEKPWRMGRTYGKIGAFTIPFNVTGQPAISVPLHWTPEGLPVGIQLVAAMGREDLLISLASDLEAAVPWYHRYPTS